MGGAASLCVAKVRTSDGATGSWLTQEAVSLSRTPGGMLTPLVSDSNGIQICKQAFGAFGSGGYWIRDLTGSVTANAAAVSPFTAVPNLLTTLSTISDLPTSVGFVVNGGTLRFTFYSQTASATVGYPVPDGQVLWVPSANVTGNMTLFSTSNITLFVIVCS